MMDIYIFLQNPSVISRNHKLLSLCYFNLEMCAWMAGNIWCFQARKRCISFQISLVQAFLGIYNGPVTFCLWRVSVNWAGVWQSALVCPKWNCISQKAEKVGMMCMGISACCLKEECGVSSSASRLWWCGPWLKRLQDIPLTNESVCALSIMQVRAVAQGKESQRTRI